MLDKILYIVCATMVALGLNHLVALFFHDNFVYYGYSVMFLMSVSFLSILFVIFKARAMIKKTVVQKSNWVFIIAFLVLNVIVVVFLLQDYVMDLSEYTYEMALEMSRSKSLYDMHPYMGTTLESAIPLRIKILYLPGLYAALVAITGFELHTLLAHVIPIVLWILGLLSATLCAKYLYIGCESKIWRFLNVYTIAFLALRNVEGVFGYQLFYSGYSGETLRTIFLIPCMVYATFSKKWGIACMLCMVEVFTVWTTYGVGYCFLVMLLSLFCTGGIQKFFTMCSSKRR